ncbi:MAG: hypothetical protein ABSF59_23995 [Candidatus Sulfotelmatobacter sp.]
MGSVRKSILATLAFLIVDDLPRAGLANIDDSAARQVLSGMTDAVVVDPDGVYDPSIINDRLLLGLKGTMSEFELNLLRQRSLEAIRQKAKRGELQFCLPVGYCWTPTGKIEMDPDRRVQQALELVFTKMTDVCGSLRLRENRSSHQSGQRTSA